MTIACPLSVSPTKETFSIHLMRAFITQLRGERPRSTSTGKCEFYAIPRDAERFAEEQAAVTQRPGVRQKVEQGEPKPGGVVGGRRNHVESRILKSEARARHVPGVGHEVDAADAFTEHRPAEAGVLQRIARLRFRPPHRDSKIAF